MRTTEAEHFIAQAAARKIDLGFTAHFWSEAGKCAPGLGKVGVYAALRKGRVYGAPIRDDQYLCHKVKFRAHMPEHGLLEFVLAITVHDSVVCITLYGIE